MSRRKRDIVIISALVPILIAVLAIPLSKMGRKVTVDDIESDEQSSANDVVSTPDIQEWREIQTKQVALEKRYLQGGMPRDPFLKESNEWVSGDVLVLRLNGILTGGAIINGKIVSEGKVIHGLTVKAINLDEVILERNGREYSLTIDKPIKIQINKR